MKLHNIEESIKKRMVNIVTKLAPTKVERIHMKVLYLTYNNLLYWNRFYESNIS